MAKKRNVKKRLHNRTRPKAVGKSTRRKPTKKDGTRRGTAKARAKLVSKVQRKVPPATKPKGHRIAKGKHSKRRPTKGHVKKAGRTKPAKRVKKILHAVSIPFEVVARVDKEEGGPKSITLRTDLPGGLRATENVFRNKQYPLDKKGFYDPSWPVAVFLSLSYEYEGKEYWRNKISDPSFSPTRSGTDAKPLTEFILERLKTWRDQFNDLMGEDEEGENESYKQAFSPENWKYLLIKLIYS